MWPWRKARPTDDPDVRIGLTHDEALILSDWLHRTQDADLGFVHPAERIALAAVDATLDKALVEVFDPRYDELVAAARERIDSLARVLTDAQDELLASLRRWDSGEGTLTDLQETAQYAAASVRDADRRFAEQLLRALDASATEFVDQVRQLVALDRVQTFCDWCYGAMTGSALQGSLAIGLDAELCWACESCLAQGRYRTPPDGWAAPPEEWPFREA